MNVGILLDYYSLHEMNSWAKANVGLCQAFAKTGISLTWYVPSIRSTQLTQQLVDLAKITPGHQKLRSLAYLPTDCEDGQIDVLQTLPSFQQIYLEILMLQRQGMLNVPVVCPIHAISEGTQDTFRFAVQSIAKNNPSMSTVSVVFPTQSCLDLYTRHLCDLGFQEMMGVISPHVIPHPLENAWFNPPPVTRNNRVNIPSGKIVIGFLGSLTPMHKMDIMPLLMLLKRLLRHRPDYHLIIAGADTINYASFLWDTIHELKLNATNDLGLREHVTLLTDLSEDEVHAFYRCIDIFVSLVDNPQESYGLTPLQAMAYEKPVVLSRSTGYKDLIKDGKNGFLVDTYVANYNRKTEAVLHLFNSIESHYLNGQSTAVDLCHAEKIVNYLADRPNVRKRIGESAQQRAWHLASVEQISANYKTLWRQISASTQVTPTTNPLTETALALRRHIAPCLPEDTYVARGEYFNPDYLILDEQFYWLPRKSIVDSIFSIVGNKVFAIGEILAEFHKENQTEVNWHILWLLKQGFLEISTDPHE